eukprot:scaffold11.g4025.t1
MASTIFAKAPAALTQGKASVQPKRRSVAVRAGAYDAELIQTAKKIASAGKGILAMDESNATCGKRLESIGLENTETNRQAYRELLVTTPGLGQYISGAILFEETLFQNTRKGTKMVDELNKQGIVPGIKVDKGLNPLSNSNGESWCAGLDGLAQRCQDYYKAGARFCKWRSVVSIPAGPSIIAQRDCAYGLARYAAIAQVAEAVWAETFKYLADNKVLFEGILLKPSMVTPGAEHAKRSTPEMLRRRVPPAVPGIMFLSGGQSELEATLNLNAMNQSPNPWHVSFSYARALQNTVLKTWKGEEANFGAAQQALLVRAAANSAAQLGKYDPTKEAESAKEGMFVAGYTY